MELSLKQKAFFYYLRQKIEQEGGFPSLRAAARELGVSHAAVARYLAVLEEKGLIKRGGRYSRKVYLLGSPGRDGSAPQGRRVPIVGRCTAGLPLYAQPEWEGAVMVDARLYPGPNLFALRVEGDSMRDAGILDRDIAIFQPRQFAANGEIVVALVHDEETTIKRFFLGPDHVELRPENPAYPVQSYGFGEILVQGRLIGIQRGPEIFDPAE